MDNPERQIVRWSTKVYPDTPFVASIKKALVCSGQIDEEDIEIALDLIQEHSKAIRKARLKTKGRCLNCQEEIEYGPPCAYHQRKGDSWLEGWLAKWLSPPKISICGSGKTESILLNNLTFGTTMPYLCEECIDKIHGLIQDRKHSDLESVRRARERELATDQAILRGERSASPSKQFYLLQAYFNKADGETFRAMSYQDFLKTRYWKIIRDYVVYERMGRCELCARKGGLDVHHKTYEHHGEEHHHRDDLIVLCRECHTKFHDKTVEG